MIAPSLLDRLLDPVTEALSAEAAKRIISLTLDSETQTLFDDFAQKAAAGSISPQEREEYAELIDGLDLLGILKSKARAALNQPNA